MNTSLLLAAALLAQTPNARYTPAEAQALFSEANEASLKNDVATAHAKYDQLLQAGLGGADVLYNLGTTHLAAGELGPAVLYLERARRASSGATDDIDANLALAQERQGDRIVGAEAAEPFVQRVAKAVDVGLVNVGFFACWYLGFAAVWVAWASSRRVWWALAAAALLLVGTGFGLVLAAHAWVSHTVVEGVVQPETVKVREFPQAAARVSFEVHAGLKVRIMEESGPFIRIRLPNALEGWAEGREVVRL